jgi:hypothetical protein
MPYDTTSPSPPLRVHGDGEILMVLSAAGTDAAAFGMVGIGVAGAMEVDMMSVAAAVGVEVLTEVAPAHKH